MRKTARIPLLIAGLVCGTIALVYLSQAVSGPARTELYADQEDLRLTIASVGKENDFLLPSLQEQAMAQQQAQRATPARFRPGQSYFVVRGFIEDRTGKSLGDNAQAGPTAVTDESGRRISAVHVTYSALRDLPNLSRMYDPPIEAQTMMRQQQLRQEAMLSNSANIRGAVNLLPTSDDAFLPRHLRAFAAFFRPLTPDTQRVDFHHTILITTMKQTEDISLPDVTVAGTPREAQASGYRVIIDSLDIAPLPTSHDAWVAANVAPLLAAGKDHRLMFTLRAAPAQEGASLPPSLRFTPPLVEDDMGDRLVCDISGPLSSVSRIPWGTGEVDFDDVGLDKRQTWVASYIDRNATRFTITTRLTAAGPPTKREFVIRDIPVP